MSLDVKTFAAELSTKLVVLLEARKEELIADAGGWPRRAAVKMAWPTLMAEVPTLTESLIELVAWKFGGMTLEDLVGAIESIKATSRADVRAGADAQVPQSRA